MTRLRQVLLNLLGNAAKFTDAGRIKLRLLLLNQAALRIEVVDTGPGVAPEDRKRLFHEFERLDPRLTDRIEGAGLGLALSARLAALMGGRLSHEDNPKGGSIFSLEIPIGPVGAMLPGDSSAEREGAGSPPAQPPIRALVVDDVAMNRDVAGSFLRAAGHEVVVAGSGAEAVALAKTSDFDVILMDVRMPEMDGLEATRHIRDLAGPRGRVPIVALTAQVYAEQVAECRAAGMTAHLAKPLTQQALFKLLATIKAKNPVGPDEAAPALQTPPPRGTVRTPVCAGASEQPALPICDDSVLQRTAACLPAAAATNYLRQLSDRSEALLRDLPRLVTGANNSAELAASAHSLAGSASMFGFVRLADLARRFEAAIERDDHDGAALVPELSACLEDSISAMRDKIEAAAVPA